jgi:large repetitive protein
MRSSAREIVALLCLISLAFFSSCGGGSDPGTVPPPSTPLVITSSALPAGTTGSDYDGVSGFSLTASGGKVPYSWNWVAAASSSLPPGLSLTGSSISGSPSTAGSYNVIVTVTDSESPVVQNSAPFSIVIDTVTPALQITSGVPPDGTVGTNYGSVILEKCVASPILGWHQVCSPCTSSSNCGSLPRCQGLFPSPCRKNVFMGFTFMATGGTLAYFWNASGLPPGLTVDPNTGDFTGTPTTAGSYFVTVTLSDSESPPAQVTTSYTIDIGG